MDTRFDALQQVWEGWPLTLDHPPEGDVFRRILDDVGVQSRDARRVEGADGPELHREDRVVAVAALVSVPLAAWLDALTFQHLVVVATICGTAAVCITTLSAVVPLSSSDLSSAAAPRAKSALVTSVT